METMILDFIPGLADYPLLLIIVELLAFLFFGGIIWSELWGLLNGYRKH